MQNTELIRHKHCMCLCLITNCMNTLFITSQDEMCALSLGQHRTSLLVFINLSSRTVCP